MKHTRAVNANYAKQFHFVHMPWPARTYKQINMWRVKRSCIKLVRKEAIKVSSLRLNNLRNDELLDMRFVRKGDLQCTLQRLCGNAKPLALYQRVPN